MTLQIRPKSTGASVMTVGYAPARDVAHLYPNLLQKALQMVVESTPPVLAEVIAEKKPTESESVTAASCLADAAASCLDDPKESLLALLDRTGYTDSSKAAQVALMYCIGTMVTATFFKGYRDLATLGDDPPPEISRLCKQSVALSQYLLAGPVKRWWIRTKAKWFGDPVEYTLGGR